MLRSLRSKSKEEEKNSPLIPTLIFCPAENREKENERIRETRDQKVRGEEEEGNEMTELPMAI